MKAETDLGTLKEFIGYVNALVDEVKITVKDTGLYAKVIDTASVCMLDIRWMDEGFEEYEHDGEPIDIGIDVKKILSALKGIKKKDTPVKFSIDIGKNTFDLECDGISKTISLIDTNGFSDPKLPKLEFDSEIEIEVPKLKQAVKSCAPISDVILLDIQKDIFGLIALNDTDKVIAKYDTASLVFIGGVKNGCRTMFTMDYFKKIVTALNTFAVKIKNKEDYPISFEFKDDWFKGTYLLAPRADTDSSNEKARYPQLNGTVPVKDPEPEPIKPLTKNELLVLLKPLIEKRKKNKLVEFAKNQYSKWNETELETELDNLKNEVE